jgi:dTDP-glucose 4,6-dehydratase
VNLGSPMPVTLLELAEAVIRVSGSRSEITYEALPVDDPRVRLPDITRARELLGWEPEISLEEGLRRLAASSRDSAARGAGPSSGHAGKPVATADAVQPSD